MKEVKNLSGKIYLTSDLHLGHDREFIWKVRGFNSIQEMNEAYVERGNSVVDNEDDVYVLGDLMLGNNDIGMNCLKHLKGRIHIVFGNHDTAKRQELYKTLPNVVETEWAIMLTYKKYHFFMTHFPCMTGNLEKESLKQMTLNLYGHTHQRNNFYEDRPYMYHVGVDSHDGYPVLLDDIIQEMKDKVKECIDFLDEEPAATGPQTAKERCDSCMYALYCRGVGLADFEGDCNQYRSANAVTEMARVKTDPIVARNTAAAISDIKEYTAGPSISSNVYSKKNYKLDLTDSRCHKCVFDINTCGSSDYFGGCEIYTRDPSDGGFYG